MRRRTLMGAVVGALGLAGCGSSGEMHTDAEWNQLLLDALEPLEHVEELIQFSYSMQGVLGRNDGGPPPRTAPPRLRTSASAG